MSDAEQEIKRLKGIIAEGQIKDAQDRVKSAERWLAAAVSNGWPQDRAKQAVDAARQRLGDGAK